MQVCYFASDFHLGAPSIEQSKAREYEIVRWLEYVAKDATDIYFVGDVFDFWFEYASVIPKGFSRFFGKIAELGDRGIQFHFFYGNHDMWVKHYFVEEFGMRIYANPIELTLYGKRIYLGHGDGLGPGDRGYKFIKRFLRSAICQWAFARIHPNFGIKLARFFSGKSREGTEHEHQFLGFEKEWLYQFAQNMQIKNPHDYYIFGHRHLPFALPISKGTYFNLGEWITYKTYMKIDSEIPQYYKWDGNKAISYEPPFGKE